MSNIALFTLRLYPDTLLTTRCVPVAAFDKTLASFCSTLIASMKAHHGVGLAANQVGVLLRIFAMSGAIAPGGVDVVFINPEVVARDGTGRLEEGCLSLPGVRYQVDSRSESVRLRYQALDGSWAEVDLVDVGALCAQHEIDHLNGLTMLDLVSPLKAGRARAKLLKSRRVGSSS